MMEFLKHPLVTFVGGILATIIVGYIFYILTIKRRPEPEWGIFSSSPVLLGDGQINSLLKITYNGIELDTLTATTIYLKNRGKLSLRKSDLTAPIRFKLSENASVIDIIDIKGSNKTFAVNNKTEENELYCYDYIDVVFDYMNPGQAVSFTVLHTGYSESCISAYADILDAELKKAKERPDKSMYLLIALVLNIVFGILFLFYNRTLGLFSYILPIVGMLGFFILTLLSLYRKKKPILPWEDDVKG